MLERENETVSRFVGALSTICLESEQCSNVRLRVQRGYRLCSQLPRDGLPFLVDCSLSLMECKNCGNGRRGNQDSESKRKHAEPPVSPPRDLELAFFISATRFEEFPFERIEVG